ncbi:hypothetical protein [Psychrobacillus phage Perkons]|nr:hypothetical protein [Psychrobacillus phage Perkons]
MNKTINFGTKNNPKYVTFLYGSDWDKEDFENVKLFKHKFGWDFNIWRFMISYDKF